MYNHILTTTNRKLDTRVKETSGVVQPTSGVGSPPSGPWSPDRFKVTFKVSLLENNKKYLMYFWEMPRKLIKLKIMLSIGITILNLLGLIKTYRFFAQIKKNGFNNVSIIKSNKTLI